MALVEDETSAAFRQLCRDYYYGDLAAIFIDFKERFVDGDTPLIKQSFKWENEAVKGINRRINYLPVDFILNAEEGKKDLKKEWEEYFKGDYFEGTPLKQLLRNIYREMELGGVTILVGQANPDDPKNPLWVLMTNVVYYPITNLDNILDISGYRFVYYRPEIDEKGNTKTVPLEIKITAERYERSVGGVIDEKNSFNLSIKDNKNNPVIPVVVFCREKLIDSVYCRPGMADLRNGSLNLNDALTKRGEVTKYTSFKVWCPAADDFAGVNLNESSTGEKRFKIKPGSYVNFPITTAGGGDSMTGVEKEIKEAREDIRAASLFVDTSDMAGTRDNESGTSKRIGSRGLRDYGTQILAQVKNSLNRLLEISSYISGRNAEGIFFTAPPIEKEDPELVAAKSDRMFSQGFDKEALRLEGYDNDEVDKLIVERDESIKTEVDRVTGNAARVARENG